MDAPQIVERPSLLLIGLEAPFIHIRSPDANSHAVIGPLWGEFCKVEGRVPNRLGHGSYGAIYSRPEAERSHPHELQYVCGATVSSLEEIPEGMVSHRVPAATYAVFEHRGPISEIGRTVQHIYGAWLPNSGYRHSGVADLEHYDERFAGDLPHSVMEYAISVERLPPASEPA